MLAVVVLYTMVMDATLITLKESLGLIHDVSIDFALDLSLKYVQAVRDFIIIAGENKRCWRAPRLNAGEGVSTFASTATSLSIGLPISWG